VINPMQLAALREARKRLADSAALAETPQTARRQQGAFLKTPTVFQQLLRQWSHGTPLAAGQK
jgi:hypothetical protein